MISLRRTTEFSLALLFTALAAVGGVASYFSTIRESGAFLDLQQRQIARYVGDLTFVAPGDVSLPPHDVEDDYVVEVTYKDGRSPRTSDPSVIIPDQRETGFSEFDDAIGHWRVFSLVTSERTVQVAQQTIVREELATDAALRATLPFLVAIPLSWLVVAFVVTHVFRRLERLAGDLSGIGDPAYGPIDLASVPREVLPFVCSINSLLERQRSAFDKQKRFLSDAAHELRTPLSALTLQIGNLVRLEEVELQSRIGELQAGARRVSTLTDQLLKITRYESLPEPVVSHPVDLAEIARDVVAGFVAAAEDKGVDLGFTRLEVVMINAPETDMRTLIESLVDNAVRYTPGGGSVDVTVRAYPQASLCVIDTGPGVHNDILPRLTERFFRGTRSGEEGTGLGLALVLAICQRHSFELSLSNRGDTTGFCAAVTLS